MGSFWAWAPLTTAQDWSAVPHSASPKYPCCSSLPRVVPGFTPSQRNQTSCGVPNSPPAPHLRSHPSVSPHLLTPPTPGNPQSLWVRETLPLKAPPLPLSKYGESGPSREGGRGWGWEDATPSPSNALQRQPSKFNQVVLLSQLCPGLWGAQEPCCAFPLPSPDPSEHTPPTPNANQPNVLGEPESSGGAGTPPSFCHRSRAAKTLLLADPTPTAAVEPRAAAGGWGTPNPTPALRQGPGAYLRGKFTVLPDLGRGRWSIFPGSGGHSRGGHPVPSPDRAPRHRGHPKRSEPGPRGGPDTECSPALRSLSSPPPGLALTAPAVLKATEPHFAAADFCPEPRRCRLRAGSLTPRAGRQRATAASAFRWPRKPGRCRGGLGASTSTWPAPELTPGLPAAVPWALLLWLHRQKGVWAVRQGTGVHWWARVGEAWAEHSPGRVSSQPPPGPFPDSKNQSE